MSIPGVPLKIEEATPIPHRCQSPPGDEVAHCKCLRLEGGECGERYDHVVLLQPTCPFRKPGFIDKCIEHFVASGADSLFSVMQVPDHFNPHWVFEPGENGYLNIATGEENLITSRQQLPPTYARDGSVYIFKADILRGQGSIYGEKIVHINSENQWHVNIDTHQDWAKAEMIANVLCSVN